MIVMTKRHNVLIVTLPSARLPDPQSVPSLRWGILGAGWIADVFASTVLANTNQRISAVASLTPGKAQAFAQIHGVGHFDLSYSDLATRDDVDAIYVANQPNDHRSAALLAIEAGKHVLIEKPLTHSVVEASDILASARRGGLLSMEAMWTRYLPQTDIARQLVETGAIGSPRLIVSDFCQDNSKMERMWRKGHGSPMWDMGIYPIALCQMFLGEPSSIEAHGILRDDQMDAQTTSYLSYPDGARATFTVSGILDAPHHAFIAGDEGVIEFGQPFMLPSSVGLAGKGFNAPMQVWKDESSIRGHAALAYQVTAFADYVSRGLLESPLQSHDDTLACLRTAAEILRLIGADAA